MCQRLGRAEEAATQREAAERVAAALDDRFWMPDEGTYALGLDPEGRQIDGVASNAGHLLWADAVPPERAAAVTERLMAPDMFSGWGIRTLDGTEARFNPMSYHNGSVWPHDNAIVAEGLSLTGPSRQASHAGNMLTLGPNGYAWMTPTAPLAKPSDMSALSLASST